MYERYSDIERVTKAMQALQQIDAKHQCYSTSCESIQHQLNEAIAFEAGHHPDMSRYSKLHHLQ
ncbi:hypothetical protein [Pseudalkalibacillus sp. SCS-8]|uniref:hypothetical protein n=1 Tax=Pseudalkalibacillus nanhaiensis TaxID=3115291 RepID=UPI0032DA10FD